MGRYFHVNGITVNKTTQTVESAAVGGVFHIEDVYPLIDGGRFPVKRIGGERVEVWADIYRDGHDVMAAALEWRPERGPERRPDPKGHHRNHRQPPTPTPLPPPPPAHPTTAPTPEHAPRP